MKNLFAQNVHDIGQTHKTIKERQKMGRGAKVDEISDIKDIAKAIREYVKKKYPKYKFSVNIDRFAGGQSLRVNWYEADFNPLVSEEAWGDIKDGKTFSVNQYYFETSEKLTKKAIAVIKDVRDFYQQYNYDYSDSQSDYYNTRFYEDFKVGTWGKPFVQTSGKPEKPKPNKPAKPDFQGGEKPLFFDGEEVIFKTSKGDKEGVVEYSKFVASQNKFIYGVRTQAGTLLTIWESNIRSKTIDLPSEPTPEPTPDKFTPERLESLRNLEDGFPDSEIGSKPLLKDKNGDYFYVIGVTETKADLVCATNIYKRILYTPNNAEIIFDFEILDFIPNGSKKLKKIVVEWSESDDFNEGETFTTWQEFQDKAQKIQLIEGYLKTKLFIIWENNRALIDRVDFGKSKGDFDPKRDFIGDYIANQTSAMYWSNFTSGKRKDEALWEDVEDLPTEYNFKVGDVFIRNFEGEIENPKITYTILSVGKEKSQYRIDYLDKQTQRLSTKSNDKISEEITTNWWIPYVESSQPETPTEITENEALKELDEELILLNELRKKTGILEDTEAQLEFREEINLLVDTRKIFSEEGTYKVEDLTKQYFKQTTENLSLSEQITELINSEVGHEFVKNVTKTKDFKNWFGDWENKNYPSSKAIKIIDVEKNIRIPLVVYHGTKNPTHYSRFKNDKFPLIYFATNRKYAEWFASLGQGIIYECFLNVRFPISFTDLGLQDITWQELSEYANTNYGLILPKFPEKTERRKFWAWIRFDAETNFSLINAIKEAGFDGIIHIENNPQQLNEQGEEEITKAYMVFDPKKVKLVKFSSDVKTFTDIMFLKKGGRLSLLEEIKNLKK
jgi:hypothetical protein